MGPFGVLGIVFVVLKLTSVVYWSWWWVLSPFYGPPLALILFAAVMSVIEETIYPRRR